MRSIIRRKNITYGGAPKSRSSSNSSKGRSASSRGATRGTHNKQMIQIYNDKKGKYLDRLKLPSISSILSLEPKKGEYDDGNIRIKGLLIQKTFPHGECEYFVDNKLLFKGIWNQGYPLYGCIYNEEGNTIIYVGGMAYRDVDNKQYEPNYNNAAAAKSTNHGKTYTIIDPVGLEKLYQLGTISDEWTPPKPTSTGFFDFRGNWNDDSALMKFVPYGVVKTWSMF